MRSSASATTTRRMRFRFRCHRVRPAWIGTSRRVCSPRFLSPGCPNSALCPGLGSAAKSPGCGYGPCSMASKALVKWQTSRQQELDELLAAHEKVGGSGPGRRYATEQLNHAYLVAVAAQFQGYCRDLHSEAVGALVTMARSQLATILVVTLTRNRKLDFGNANEGSIADDFARIGMEDFWPRVAAEGGQAHTKARRKRLEQMNLWRNAIAHDNFEQNQVRIDKLDGHLRPRLAEVKRCRNACRQLAVTIEAAVAMFLTQVVGRAPW